MEGFQNFNVGNFDPNTLANQTSDVIQFVVVLDKSGSVDSFKDVMNTALRDVFMVELKSSHRKNDIVVKCIEFNNKVDHKSGFMPILNLSDDYLELKNPQGTTALYDAVLQALEHVQQYRDDLEDQGVNVRTCVFICTDGCDNASSIQSAPKIRQIVEDLRKKEIGSSFTINVLGVGLESEFRAACVEMGLNPDKCLSTVGATAKEIRAQMGVVSQSVSSSSTSTTVNF